MAESRQYTFINANDAVGVEKSAVDRLECNVVGSITLERVATVVATEVEIQANLGTDSLQQRMSELHETSKNMEEKLLSKGATLKRDASEANSTSETNGASETNGVLETNGAAETNGTSETNGASEANGALEVNGASETNETEGVALDTDAAISEVAMEINVDLEAKDALKVNDAPETNEELETNDAPAKSDDLETNEAPEIIDDPKTNDAPETNDVLGNKDAVLETEDASGENDIFVISVVAAGPLQKRNSEHKDKIRQKNKNTSNENATSSQPSVLTSDATKSSNGGLKTVRKKKPRPPSYIRKKMAIERKAREAAQAEAAGGPAVEIGKPPQQPEKPSITPSEQQKPGVLNRKQKRKLKAGMNDCLNQPPAQISTSSGEIPKLPNSNATRSIPEQPSEQQKPVVLNRKQKNKLRKEKFKARMNGSLNQPTAQISTSSGEIPKLPNSNTTMSIKSASDQSSTQISNPSNAPNGEGLKKKGKRLQAFGKRLKASKNGASNQPSGISGSNNKNLNKKPNSTSSGASGTKNQPSAKITFSNGKKVVKKKNPNPSKKKQNPPGKFQHKKMKTSHAYNGGYDYYGSEDVMGMNGGYYYPSSNNRTDGFGFSYQPYGSNDEPSLYMPTGDFGFNNHRFDHSSSNVPTGDFGNQSFDHSSSNMLSTDFGFGNQPFGHSNSNIPTADFGFGNQAFGHSSSNMPTADSGFGNQPFGHSSSNMPTADFGFGNQPFGHASSNMPTADSGFGNQPFGHSSSNMRTADSGFGNQPFGHASSNMPTADSGFGNQSLGLQSTSFQDSSSVPFFSAESHVERSDGRAVRNMDRPSPVFHRTPSPENDRSLKRRHSPDSESRYFASSQQRRESDRRFSPSNRQRRVSPSPRRRFSPDRGLNSSSTRHSSTRRLSPSARRPQSQSRDSTSFQPERLSGSRSIFDHGHLSPRRNRERSEREWERDPNPRDEVMVDAVRSLQRQFDTFKKKNATSSNDN